MGERIDREYLEWIHDLNEVLDREPCGWEDRPAGLGTDALTPNDVWEFCEAHPLPAFEKCTVCNEGNQ